VLIPIPKITTESNGIVAQPKRHGSILMSLTVSTRFVVTAVWSGPQSSSLGCGDWTGDSTISWAIWCHSGRIC